MAFTRSYEDRRVAHPMVERGKSLIGFIGFIYSLYGLLQVDLIVQLVELCTSFEEVRARISVQA